MKSITIHGLDDPLDTLIRERAGKQNLSLNKTVRQLPPLPGICVLSIPMTGHSPAVLRRV